MKKYICYNAGCEIYDVVKFDAKIGWHKEEFTGTRAECLKEKEYQEYAAYRFNNCLPHLDHC